VTSKNERAFYRIIRDEQATHWDFMSNEARRRQPRRPLLPTQRRLWRGLSHFDSLEIARAAARQTPSIGSFIAEIVVPDDAEIEIEQTGRPGHYTIWASPGRMLGYVRRVFPVNVVD